METQKYNIAIVGAGIIGLYLASELAKQGHKVSVFEKKSEENIGNKICSALYSERLLDFIPQANEFVENTINGCEINFPKKKILLEFQPKHLVLDREKLVLELVSLAKKSGVEIIYNGISALPNGYDFVIGCDGAASVVRKSLYLDDPEISLGIKISVPENNNLNIVSTYPVKSGFCWKIPKGNFVEYGAMGDQRFIEDEFTLFLKQQEVNYSSRFFGAAIPQGLIIPNNETVTLCGDASGLTKPWSGGGIIWGLTQADILLKTFPNFRAYKKETFRRFNWLILKGKISKKLVYFFGKNFPYILPRKLRYDNDFPSFIKAVFSGF
jgi:flavin-dependent dehydrogenase